LQNEVVVVVGLGEIGKPLFDILSRSYKTIGVDIQPVQIEQPCSVMHICIPFQIPDFVGTCAAYIAKYKPAITVINSTISPGTTRAITERSGGAVAYSPVRGKHVKMEKDLLFYKKFVGASDAKIADALEKHFAAAGFRTERFANPDAGEVAKLLETTYLGVLVGWQQEVERISASLGGSHQDSNKFIEEIAFLPHGIFPGFIGGHCVMPNIEILRSRVKSEFLDAIHSSNEKKAAEMKASAQVGGR
jgi:UDP-N-acetyl-D-mannosaminuronate dehydrogenase